MSFLPKPLRRFIRNEDGLMIVEALVVIPFLVWAFVTIFAFWDSYRTINTVQKASYTIADLVSRAQIKLNNTYILGIRDTMNYMLSDGQVGEIRITSYEWVEHRDRFEVIFSHSTNPSLPALTTSNLAALTDRLPTMLDGDSAVLMETSVPYSAAFGLRQKTIGQFIATRPRFLPKICHVSYEC